MEISIQSNTVAARVNTRGSVGSRQQYYFFKYWYCENLHPEKHGHSRRNRPAVPTRVSISSSRTYPVPEHKFYYRTGTGHCVQPYNRALGPKNRESYLRCREPEQDNGCREPERGNTLRSLLAKCCARAAVQTCTGKRLPSANLKKT